MKGIFQQLSNTFAPLENRNLKRYLGAKGFALVASWMQTTAAAWLVWNLTHSATSLGLLAVLGLTPFLFLAPWTGALADRLNRRNILFTTQTVSMLLAFSLAILVQSDLIRLWHVYTLAVFIGCAAAFDVPTHQAFLGDLSGISEVRNTLMVEKIIFQSSRLLGPPIAGFLIAGVGMASVFWLTGLGCLIVILVLRRISATQTHSRREGTSFHGFTAAIRFLRDQPRIQYLFAVSVLVAFLGFSSLQMLSAYVSDVLRLGARTFGILMGASGLGALFGSLFVAPIVNRSHRIAVVLAGTSAWAGACLFVLGCSKSFPLSLVAVIAGSAAMPVVMVTASGLIQTLSEEGMRARLVSLLLMLTYGVQPIVTLLVGYYANSVGVDVAIALNGAVMVVGSLVIGAGGLKFGSL